MEEVTLKDRLIAFKAIVLSSLVFYCPESLAQCSLNIQSGVRSGWSKQLVHYTVEKNTLKVKVGEGSGDDADSIYIGSMKGCGTLTIEVSKITGRYPWGGKAIGFSFFDNKREPSQWGNQASFPAPKGYVIEEGFVKAAISTNTKLVYDIANSTETTHIGAKLFIGSNNALELQFNAQEASRDLQFSARPPVRSSERLTTYTVRQPSSPAVSCSSNCHERRSEHRRFAFNRDFSIPARASCQEWDD
jgi:hypothetical protein